jgi:uncharacterized protein YbbC (DUF1343 family)
MRKLFFALLLVGLISPLCAQRVRTGADVFCATYIDSLSGKRVGVVCNQASVLANGTHLVDTLIARKVAVTALFAPEHGIRGTAAAGAKIADGRDPATGVPVYSLYGNTQRPTPEMLKDVDVLLFDLQDIGARFYTYASTMSSCMEAARDLGKQIIILDRPNPINGTDVEGPVLDMELISFLGLFPIPVRHGLTLGELAKMIIGEGWLSYNSQVDLRVIPMEGWKRSMWFDQTGLPWVAPSPSMKTLATATVYPGTCLFEATNVSEGRGTSKPFEWIGVPRVDGAKVAGRLNALGLPGVKFEPIQFTPLADTPSVPNPPYNRKSCSGVYVKITNRKVFKPVLTGVMMLSVFRTFPKFQLRQGLLDRLAGDRYIGDQVDHKTVDRTILNRYQKEVNRFLQMRKKYLLYPEH